MKKEWYLQYWFICLLFMFSAFILPAILGVILFIKSFQEDEKIKKAFQLEIDELKNQQLDIDKLKIEKQQEIDRIRDETKFEFERFKIDKQQEIDDFKNERQRANEEMKKNVEIKFNEIQNKRQKEIEGLKTEHQQELEKLQTNHKHEMEELKTELLYKQQEINELENVNERRKIEYENMYNNKLNDEKGEVILYKKELERYKEERNKLAKEISDLNKEYLIESVSIEAYKNLKSDEVKNQLQLLSLTQKEMIKNDTALVIDDIWAKKSQLEVQKRQILRCFNSESISIIESVNVRNIDSCRNKLSRAFENINKIFKSDGVQISKEYLETKLDELSMMYAYMIKVEEERELQRAIREQMQEEEKVRREIEREKQKIEKEESQFGNEIKKLIGYMQKTSNDIEKQLYIEKIKELEEKLKLLETDKENVLEREQKTRAGYVYIISNIGSFGENIYKIGMTRRLEPMERISELSDASVPFPFDVHAMIFSDDAPALENILHQTFSEYQINKVNPRKEFFKVDLEKIKDIVKNNHNATVQFMDIPDAVEYRETLKLLSANNETLAC